MVETIQWINSLRRYKQSTLVKIRKFEQPTQTQNHSLTNRSMFVTITFTQSKIVMWRFFSFDIFADYLEIHDANICYKNLVSKCLVVHTMTLFQNLKNPIIEFQSLTKNAVRNIRWFICNSNTNSIFNVTHCLKVLFTDNVKSLSFGERFRERFISLECK